MKEKIEDSVNQIYWFSYFNNSEPSVRYRAIYPLEFMKEKYGADFSFVYPDYKLKNISRFISIYFEILFFRKKNSVIVFQKIYSKGLYSVALKFLLFLRRKKTFYDIDDAEYLRRPPETIHFFMKNCSGCLVGSVALAEYVSLHFKSKTELLTSPVIHHHEIKENKNETLTIGWIGYYESHFDSLSKLFFPAIQNIDFKITLVILGLRFPEDEENLRNYFSKNKNVIIEIPADIDWLDEKSIYERIKIMDVGIAPLLNTAFNQAKSAFKLKQYLSCGVPVLASMVGENIRFIDHAVNGFICNSPEEFLKNLNIINQMNAEEYSLFSKQARLSLNKFDIDNYCSDFITSIGIQGS